MKCPCCASVRVTLQKKPEEHLYCRTCRHRFKTHIPFENYYRKLSGRSAGAGKNTKRKNAERIGSLGPYIHNGLRILELGCAEGLLGEAVKKKWDVHYYGIEPSGDAKVASTKLNHVWGSINGVPARLKFHLILAFHALEHVTNLARTISRLSEHLDDEGVLVVEVPHCFGNQRIPWDFHKEHIHIFGPTSLTCLLERHGFYIKDLRTGFYESDIYNDSMRAVGFKRKKAQRVKDDLVKRFQRFLGQRFVIYGVGGDFESFVFPYIKAPQAVALIDSSAAKWGRRIWGKTVQPPQAVARYRRQRFLIATYRYQGEIRSLLREKGVADSQMVTLEDILGVDG